MALSWLFQKLPALKVFVIFRKLNCVYMCLSDHNSAKKSPPWHLQLWLLMKLSKWILILGRNTGDCWQKTNDPLRKISPGSNWELWSLWWCWWWWYWSQCQECEPHERLLGNVGGLVEERRRIGAPDDSVPPPRSSPEKETSHERRQTAPQWTQGMVNTLVAHQLDLP